MIDYYNEKEPINEILNTLDNNDSIAVYITNINTSVRKIYKSFYIKKSALVNKYHVNQITGNFSGVDRMSNLTKGIDDNITLKESLVSMLKEINDDKCEYIAVDLTIPTNKQLRGLIVFT